MQLNVELEAWILSAIRCGESQASIAKALGISPSYLCETLQDDARNPGISERSAQAREQSAEAWLDRGMQVLMDAATTRDSAVVQAARAIAQECARRAAIRNPKYKERSEVAVTGAGGGPIKVAAIAASVTAEQAAAAYKDILG